MIARIEGLGPAKAPINSGGGFEMRPDIRNNSRVMFDDVELARSMFERIRTHLPDSMYFEQLTPSGVNERFRGYRYQSGERFSAHYDGSFRRSADEESTLTFMVYLNEDFEGGGTKFFDHDVEVVPKAGLAVLFQHALHHEGSSVLSGTKYVLRTDVMYRKR